MDPIDRENKIACFSKKISEVALAIEDKNLLNIQLEKLLLTPVHFLLGEIEMISSKELEENILYL
jgi:hypothetical protein